MFEFPLFVTVEVIDPVLPTFTLPKFSVELLNPRRRVDATPVPLKEIVSGEFGALLTNEIVPVTLPAALGAKTALNVVDWPAAMVTCAAIPEVLKPAPATVTEEIVTVALPPFLSVMVWELFVPVVTLPNAALVGVAVSCGCVPVPLKLIVAGEFGALLTIEMLPLTLPADVGANLALNVVLNPAPNVTGVVIPVVLKPAPVTVTAEMVTVALPPFVRVMVCELFVPVATLPNAAVVGVAASCACVPVPLNAIVVGEFGALLTIEMLPLAFPADVGANLALNVVLSPAPKVSGVVNPLMLRPAPDTVALEIVRLAVPEFVNVMDWVPLLPTAIDPKFTLEGLAPTWPCVPVPDNAIDAGEPGALLTIEMLPVAAPAEVGAKMAENEALLPALIVIGMLAPLVLNPVPEAVAPVTVNVPVPAFVSVTVCVPLLPTETLPNATLAGLIVSWGCVAVPEPDKAMESGEPGALLTIEMLPEALPAVVGENFAVNEVLCPAFSVDGVRPVMLNPVPDALPDEIATLAVPEFVRVTLTDPLAPTSRLPKLMLAGFAVRFPCTPVPLSAIATVGTLAVLVTTMLPVAAPAVVGANCAVKVVL
jgi:hypothetical protein